MIYKHDNLSIETSDDVYEPSDDTYLLIDALKKADLKKDAQVLEIGCGTGIVSITISTHVKNITACDINPHAVELAESNIKRNKIDNIQVIESDLFAQITGKFDLIIFNTPYLPQDEENTVEGEINHAWDGGKDGRKVIDRFLAGAINHLVTGGQLIFLESSLSSYEKSIDFLKEKGFNVNLMGTKKLHFEELIVIEAVKN